MPQCRAQSWLRPSAEVALPILRVANRPRRGDFFTFARNHDPRRQLPRLFQRPPFLARLTERRRLSQPAAKRTRNTSSWISPAAASLTKCGDSLGVFPTNDPAHVDALLQAMGHSGHELVALKNLETLTLREALLARVNARANPTKKSLIIFRAFAQAEDEKARLHNLLENTKPEELPGLPR